MTKGLHVSGKRIKCYWVIILQAQMNCQSVYKFLWSVLVPLCFQLQSSVKMTVSNESFIFSQPQSSKFVQDESGIVNSKNLTVIVPIREVGLSASSAENLEKNPKVGSQ